MSYLGGKLTTAALKVDNFLTGTPEAKQFLKPDFCSDQKQKSETSSLKHGITFLRKSALDKG